MEKVEYIFHVYDKAHRIIDSRNEFKTLRASQDAAYAYLKSGENINAHYAKCFRVIWTKKKRAGGRVRDVIKDICMLEYVKAPPKIKLFE